ncbi:Rieske 2Fe-2S domain-containing protein [Bradyrhizobium tunisiense]|uniref:Rieske 2Fe-2S domain-containing protein n=1 Tax=Bradyrhizobium tunisiense TaxID=3278709 RepID=UPI0035E222E5
MYQHGWFQVAFEQELKQEISSAVVGKTRLMILRSGAEISAYDAICPHRGADLSIGGQPEGGAVICPFHGFRIGLGTESKHGFCVRRYRTLAVSGLIFVQLSDKLSNGFGEAINRLAETHSIMPGFALDVRSSADIVVENAFDQSHFGPVHAIGMNGAFALRPSCNGELAVDGAFELPSSRWQRGHTEGHCVPFRAVAFSPGVVISDLGGEYPYTIITSSTPNVDGTCTIRLSLALPKDEHGRPPAPDLCQFLLRRSREGLEQDRVVWEHRCEERPARYTSLDRPVREFRMFCARFTELPNHAQSMAD